MVKRTRVQVAREIAIATVVFVRKAREAGHVNEVAELTLLEVAQERGYEEGRDFTLSTAVKETMELVWLTGEWHLLDDDLRSRSRKTGRRARQS